MVSKSKLLKESDISLLKLYAGQAPDNTHSYHDREITDPVAQFAYQLKGFIPNRLSFRVAEKVLASLKVGDYKYKDDVLAAVRQLKKR